MRRPLQAYPNPSRGRIRYSGHHPVANSSTVLPQLGQRFIDLWRCKAMCQCIALIHAQVKRKGLGLLLAWLPTLRLCSNRL